MRALLCLIMVVFLSGCTTDIGVNTYDSESVGNAADSYPGVIIKSRHVKVKENNKLSSNTTGIGIGALAGGVAGNMIGGGRGQLASTALGALAGGTLGAVAQGKLSEQTGIEYSVKLDNGRIITLVQGTDVVFSVGQKVLVVIPTRHNARARIIAL